MLRCRLTSELSSRERCTRTVQCHSFCVKSVHKEAERINSQFLELRVGRSQSRKQVAEALLQILNDFRKPTVEFRVVL